jgi:hypothetical protein
MDDDKKRKRIIVMVGIAVLVIIFCMVAWINNLMQNPSVTNKNAPKPTYTQNPPERNKLTPSQLLAWLYRMEKKIQKLELKQNQPTRWQENIHTISLMQNDTMEKTNILINKLIKEIKDVKILLKIRLSAQERKKYYSEKTKQEKK